jgi:hypothetical protein
VISIVAVPPGSRRVSNVASATNRHQNVVAMPAKYTPIVASATSGSFSIQAYG